MHNRQPQSSGGARELHGWAVLTAVLAMRNQRLLCTRVGGQRRERFLTFAGKFEVFCGLGCREGRGVHMRLDSGGHDVRTIDQLVAILPKHSQLGHGRLEARGHEVLLIDESLPEARSAWITGQRKVRLEAHLARVVALAQRERRRDLANVVRQARETDALEQHLKEDLRVERERRRVKRRGVDGRIDFVRARDGVRSEQADDLEGREIACVGEAAEDLVHAVFRHLRLRSERL